MSAAQRHLQSRPLMIVGAVLTALLGANAAQAQGMPCEQLRDQIAARIALPTGTYRLDIALKDAAVTGKTMGTREMGARKIVFTTAAASDAPPSSTTAAQAAAPSSAWPASAAEPRAGGEAPAAAVPPTANVKSNDLPAATLSRPAARRGGPDEATWNQYMTWIAEARAMHPYADSVERMVQVMLCESGGNAGIVNKNGLHHGLFQYMVPTWNGKWNSYRDAQLTDARAQIFATALSWSTGGARQWGCYTRAH